MDVTLNSKKLILQDRGTNIQELLDGINAIIQEFLIEPTLELEAQNNVDTATSVFLDHIGTRIKLQRPGVPSETVESFGFDDNGVSFDQGNFGTSAELDPVADVIFRRYLKARGGQLLTDGTIGHMSSVIQQAFEAGHYIDNQDMTMDVRIDIPLEPWEIDLMIETGLITKPAGVRIRYIYNTDSGSGFGFDDNGDNFDQSGFAQIVEV